MLWIYRFQSNITVSIWLALLINWRMFLHPHFKLKKLKFDTEQKYCGWLKFRGVPIFMVFVEGPIHEFQYQRNGNILYELWKKILWRRILNPKNVSFLFNPRKLVHTKIKPSFCGYMIWVHCYQSNITLFISLALLTNRGTFTYYTHLANSTLNSNNSFCDDKRAEHRFQSDITLSILFTLLMHRKNVTTSILQAQDNVHFINSR